MSGVKSIAEYQKAYIGGQWIENSSSGTRHTVYNPSTGKAIGTIPNCTYEETQAAIKAADVAQKQWEKVPAVQRAKICRKMAALLEKYSAALGAIISAESGKPIKEAMGENGISVAWFEWYAGEAERIIGDVLPPHRPNVRPFVHKKAIGVVAIVTPWNHPSAMVTRSLAGAVAAGCSVVLKPSELTPYSALAIADLMDQAGFPKGLFNVVTGLPKPIGEAFADSKVVRKLCFTGSTRTGKMLMKQSVNTVKHCAMELGGNAPMIVFEDAHIDLAVQGLVIGKFRGAGQTCISMNRVYVHEKVHDKFVEKLAALMKKSLITGNGSDPSRTEVTLGPVINKAAHKKILGNIEKAKQAGAVVVMGGGRPEKETAEELNGNFIAPTILVNCDHKMELCCTEIFGPVLPILKFTDENEVVALANDTGAGLAAYFFTQDAERMDRVAQQLKYGMIGINEGMLSAPYTPFGGVKESGIGRDGGPGYGIAEFLDVVLHLYGRSKL